MYSYVLCSAFHLYYEQFTFNFSAIPFHFQIPTATTEQSVTSWVQACLFPIDISPYSVSTTIVSQLFPSRGYL